MKKILLFLVAIVLVAGVGFVGYTVFSTKNIDKVEIEGNVQTLYLLNETETPDFQDAKLKITYKSGDVKYLDMKSSNLTIDNFSTSLEKHATMKITYKSQLITVDYNVIIPGLYYMNSYEEEIYENNQSIKTGGDTITIQANPKYYLLSEDGVLKYYEKKGADWYLYDGNYLSGYKYEVVDNKVKIYLNNETPSYELTAEAIDGKMKITSTNYMTKNEFVVGKTVYNFVRCANMKTNVTVSTVELQTEDYLTEPDTGEKFLMFEVGDTLTDSANEMYLKVNYTSHLLYIEDLAGGDPYGILGQVYVVLDDSMVKGDTLQTNSKISYLTRCDLSYESKLFSFYYMVKDY